MNEAEVRQRIIGLQACAKVVHREDQDLEETARKAITLYDLLLVNAKNPDLLPNIGCLKYQPAATIEEKDRVRAFIMDTGIEAGSFIQWAEIQFPEVKTGGMRCLSGESAGKIVANPDRVLESFRNWETVQKTRETVVAAS